MRTYSLSFACGSEADPKLIKNQLSEAYPGTMVQTFSDKAASNGFFVRMLAAQTLRAGQTGSLLAKKPEMDFLLRLGGTTQISDAISSVGSRTGQPFVVVVAGLKPLKKTRRVLGHALPASTLSESELRRIEKAALLSARRA